MAVALDLGGTPVALGELQNAVEDYTVSQSTEFAVEHDHQGRHTKTFTDPLTVSGQSSLLGGLILGAMLAFGDEFSQEVSVDLHDYDNLDGSPIEEVVMRLQALSAIDLTGIVPADPTRRQVHLIENGGSQPITLVHNDTANSAYPFSLPGEVDLEIGSGGVVMVQWDWHSEVWRLVQGAATSMVRNIQRVNVTWGSGATTATAAISSVNVARTTYEILGERHTISAGFPTIQNLSMIDTPNCTSTVVALRRASGTDSGSGAVTDTTTLVQIVEYV